ncbi:MAG: hypothetical protein P4L84_30480 [Isosphaeraceae bacterium]|nr:hypothetical protein [Isosphaeraceae bacterium]
MASKNKKKSDRSPTPGTDGARQEVERLMAKERLKDAVKQAKLYHRDEPSPESHRLLERAYLLRADELRRNAMPTAAREVAQHLVDFGITDPGLVEPATKLFLTVGMSRRAQELAERIESPGVRSRLMLEVADQAVLHPELALEAPADVREGAAAVRQALEALQAGDESRGLDTLRDVSRNSPFADWKLFARGLAAHHRGDAAEARANWDRLDPERTAARVAHALSALGGMEGATGAINLEILEKQCFGDPILEPLGQLRELVADGQWDEALRRITPLRLRLRRIDPKLAEWLARALYDEVLRDAVELPEFEAMSLIKDFMRISEPLPIDPHWHRFQALLWQGPHGALDEAEDLWRKYAEDLKSLPILPPEERTLAQALVLAHVGAMYVDAADDADAPPSPFARPSPFAPPPADFQYERDRAVACLEESLRLAPDRRETYHTLLDAYEGWNQPEDAIAVGHRLLARFPDDVDALESFTAYHLGRGEPAQALDYIQRSRALKPLDPTYAQEEWSARAILSRHLGLAGRIEEARAELDRAERACPEWSRKPGFTARHVALELKAGEPERAQERLHELLDRTTDPAPLWLALLIEAIRHQLPKAERDRFEAHWLTALSKKVRGETAAELTDLVGNFVAERVDYAGKDVHVKQVLEYVRRASRVKYARADDLARVCAFLALLPQEQALFKKMAVRGLKLFPKSATFLSMAGALEMEKGPSRGNIERARHHFEKALEYARASNNPTETDLIPGIQETLARLDAIGEMLPPGGFGGAPRSFQAMMEALAEQLDFESDDFDDDDDDMPRTALPQPRSGRKNKKG